MSYVDGYVLPLPKDKLEEYRRIASFAADVWMEYGALSYRECVAEDVTAGERTSFPRSVQLEPHETVVFAYIAFASRAHRDEVNAKVMKDPRMNEMKEMPFDMSRMICGGFETIVER